MEMTEVYKLIKPDEEDFFDVLNQNDNMDIIEKALVEKAENKDPVFSGVFSQNRKPDSIVGINSHAEGSENVAGADSSHAEGRLTIAGGAYSHAEGYQTLADVNSAHAEGRSTRATSVYSHAEGNYTFTSGTGAHAEGYKTRAEGVYSHAEGDTTTAIGENSHSEGKGTVALRNQHATGHYNDTQIAKAGSDEGSGEGTAFVIGNGTNDVKSNAFRVNYNGQTYAKMSTINTGADYAEFFEWKDSNTNKEDRVGYFVTFSDGDKIQIANKGDYILGIVSGNPCIIGNGDEDWSGRFKRDNFNRFIMQDIEVRDPETEEVKSVTTYVTNPDYEPQMEYEQRFDRKEWDAIGMVGVLGVYDDGTCKVDGYCKCADGGIATAADTYYFGAYRVIDRIAENIIKIVIK